MWGGAGRGGTHPKPNERRRRGLQLVGVVGRGRAGRSEGERRGAVPRGPQCHTEHAAGTAQAVQFPVHATRTQAAGQRDPSPSSGLIAPRPNPHSAPPRPAAPSADCQPPVACGLIRRGGAAALGWALQPPRRGHVAAGPGGAGRGATTGAPRVVVTRTANHSDTRPSRASFQGLLAAVWRLGSSWSGGGVKATHHASQ